MNRYFICGQILLALRGISHRFKCKSSKRIENIKIKKACGFELSDLCNLLGVDLLEKERSNIDIKENMLISCLPSLYDDQGSVSNYFRHMLDYLLKDMIAKKSQIYCRT